MTELRDNLAKIIAEATRSDIGTYEISQCAQAIEPIVNNLIEALIAYQVHTGLILDQENKHPSARHTVQLADKALAPFRRSK